MTWNHVGGMQGGGNRQSHKWELSLSAAWPWPAAVYLKYLIMNTMAAAGSGSVADKSQGSWRWRDKKRGWASEHELAPFHHPQLAFTVARVKMLQSTLLARCPIYRGLQFLHRCNIYISALCKRPTRALRICKISCLVSRNWVTCPHSNHHVLI